MTGLPWSARVLEVYDDQLDGAATLEDGFGPVTVDVPADRWVHALTLARDVLGCTFFDWLSAVDQLEDGFAVVCHLAARRTGGVDHLVLRTVVARDHPTVASVSRVFAGARWHERETCEMFGIDFTEGGAALTLDRLLLAEEFEGHPLRKEFVLASRVARAWPGAKEPGESDASVRAPRSRRRTRPPGVPDPDEWGPR
jgi:NADH:ubiquinone oxidoreductase subunit C